METLGGNDRAALQEAGRTLERDTDGRWLADAAAGMDAKQLIVDAARTPAQAQSLLDAGSDTVLIYLAASEEACRRRYAEREDPVDAGIDFDQMLQGELPLQPELRTLAHCAIETDNLQAEQVVEYAMRFLVDVARK
jgi:RNase adaptor protein for sRNA GlmZ degradation